MFGFNLAIVTKALPDQHGILVAYRNGVEHLQGVDADGDTQPFVRVLERRAHSYGGSTLCLPEVGELGVVVEIEPGLAVWIGSLPWEEMNQMDPRPGLEAWHHSSGTEVLCTAEGDMQLTHPSGFRITIASLDGAAVPVLQGSTPSDQVRGAGGDDPHMVIYHPSGFVAHLDDEGNLKVDSPASIEGNFAGTAEMNVVGSVLLTTQSTLMATAKSDVSVSTDANLTATAKGTCTLTSDGNTTIKAPKIILDAELVECSTRLTSATASIGGIEFSTHEHTGVEPGSSDTGGPVAP